MTASRLPPALLGRLRLPVIAAPMFLVSFPPIVTAMCKAGFVCSFPHVNARSSEILDRWLSEMTAELSRFAAMISQGAAAVRGLRLAQWFGLSERDGFVGWLPLYHCGGDESLYPTVHTGGVFCPLRKADPETMFRVIGRDRLTWTLLLPGVLTDFLNHPRRRDFDLSSLRFAIGYANMMPDIIAELTATFSISIFDAYGQSESSYLLAHGVSGPGESPSLRKRPTPLMDVRIVDDAMNDLPFGVPGECVVRGPGVMSCYLDDPKANEDAFRGGRLHTGDLLRKEADGSQVFVDRKKYLIKTGGENVYPREVEAVLARHPAVQEVCVFGVPDPHWGEGDQGGRRATCRGNAERRRRRRVLSRAPRRLQAPSLHRIRSIRAHAA
jgi:fatty-acyl-CoA synthase